MEKRTEKIKWWIRNKIREILTLISVNLCKIETKVDKWGWWEKLKEKYVRNRNKITSIQIGMIVLIGYYMDKELFIEKLKSVIIITMIILGIKYIYEGVLRYFGWDGKKSSLYDREWGENVWEYFQKNQRMKKLGIIILKYIHIYRIILIMRNKIAKGLRYVRYVMIKNEKVYKNWVKVERVGTKIITFIVFEYISRMLIGEMYLEIKKGIIGKKLKEIIRGRIQLFWLICITKGVISFIVVIMIIKLIKLILLKTRKWAFKRHYEANDLSNEGLNLDVLSQSYILNKVEFGCGKGCYRGYDKILPVNDTLMEGDSLYNIIHPYGPVEEAKEDVIYWDGDGATELRYMDIYKGVKMNDIGELNYVIESLCQDRLDIEYVWKKEKNKEKKEMYGKMRAEMQKACDVVTKVMRKLHEKKVEGIKLMFIVKPKMYAMQIYITVDEEYIKKVKEIGEEISLEKERDEIQEHLGKSLSILWKWAGRDKDKTLDLSAKWQKEARDYYNEKFQENRALSRTEVAKITEEFFLEIISGELKSMLYV